MNNNIGIYACTCGVIIRNGGVAGAQGVGSRTQKESHEPSRRHQVWDETHRVLYTQGKTAAAIRTVVHPPARSPTHTPAFPGPRSTILPPGCVDGFRSQGGCDARYTRPVAPIGPTTFPSATAVAPQSPRDRISLPAAALPVSLPIAETALRRSYNIVLYIFFIFFRRSRCLHALRTHTPLR